MVHFCDLRFLESRRWIGEVGAGVDKFRVEPQLVELVAQVVVAMDILPRPPRRIVLNQFVALRSEAGIPARFLHAFVDPDQKIDEIPIDAHASGRVSFAEADLRVAQQFEKRFAVADADGESRLDAGRSVFLASEDDPDGRRSDGVENLFGQPAIEMRVHANLDLPGLSLFSVSHSRAARQRPQNESVSIPANHCFGGTRIILCAESRGAAIGGPDAPTEMPWELL